MVTRKEEIRIKYQCQKKRYEVQIQNEKNNKVLNLRTLKKIHTKEVIMRENGIKS